jgi:hypothetical protein
VGWTTGMTSSIPPKVRARVLSRDGFRCIAPQLDGLAGWCRDVWGNPITSWPNYDRGPQFLQMSHTKAEGELSMSMKAPSTQEYLVSLCPHHHTGTTAGSNWEAVNRNKIRRFLDRIYRPAQA